MTDLQDPILTPDLTTPDLTAPMMAPSAPRSFEATLPVGVTDSDGSQLSDVVLRKMTGREEAVLADRKYQRNGGKLVTELLTQCIVSLGGKSAERRLVRAMSSVDRNYLLLKLRSITFGSELEARYACPSCGSVDMVTEDLDELPVRQSSGSGEIEIELEDGYYDNEGCVHTSVVLRLPNGADEEAVAGQIRENASTGKNALLGRCLISLGMVERHRLDAMGSRILADLTLSDRRLIDRTMSDMTPGVDLTRHLDCPDCGHEYEANLDMSNFLSLA